MKIKTSDLIGPALDWAVAKCERWTNTRCGKTCDCLQHRNPQGECDLIPIYSTDWFQGGPIIERGLIAISPYHYTDESWSAALFIPMGKHFYAYGPTALVAAMRCYVASKLGDEVEVPEEL